jgi:general stress protein 26
MTRHEDRAKAIQEISKKIKGIRTAMLTTVDESGKLVSRPMATQDVEFDGDIWFFTYADAPKVGNIQRDQQVNLAYVKEDDNRYVSLTGTARLVRDRAKIEQYWKPFLQAWFPKGKDDPNLALLTVTVQSAEYWDGPGNFIGQALVLAKDVITGDHSPGGENEKIELR